MPSLTHPIVPGGRMRAMPQPTIDASPFVVRPWRPADAPVVYAAYQDLAIQRWHVRAMADVGEARHWIGAWPDRWQAETGADWAVSDGDFVLGRVGFRRLDLWDGIAELAYWVVPAARGHGVAVLGVEAVCEWAFDVLGLNRIEASHAVDNPPSCRVAVKAGLDLEGTMWRQGHHADGWHDMHLHALLAP